MFKNFCLSNFSIKNRYLILIVIFVLIIITTISYFCYSNNKTKDLYYSQPIQLRSLKNKLCCKVKSIELITKKNDSLKSILMNQGIAYEEVIKIVTKFNQVKPYIPIGTVINLYYTNDKNKNVKKIIIDIDKTEIININKSTNNNFEINVHTVQFNKIIKKSSSVIKSNLISTLQELKLPHNSIMELINAYSNQIDFKKQQHNNDTITLLYETFYKKDDNKFSHNGEIIFASVVLAGKQYKIYKYSPHNNATKKKFFLENGQRVKNNVLRLPLNSIRISSHYGPRKHPVLGGIKMHKGVDFAAKKGTPIYAAGHGIITDIGWRSGYGKYIQIKHNTNLSTAYAHASNFAKNLKIGTKVHKGQLIAYVGNTGRATGYHLHYEIKVNGKHVNPLSVKNFESYKLNRLQMKQFTLHKQYIHTLNNQLEKSLFSYK